MLHAALAHIHPRVLLSELHSKYFHVSYFCLIALQTNCRCRLYYYFNLLKVSAQPTMNNTWLLVENELISTQFTHACMDVSMVWTDFLNSERFLKQLKVVIFCLFINYTSYDLQY